MNTFITYLFLLTGMSITVAGLYYVLKSIKLI